MKNKTYEEIVERLRQIEPKPDKSREITESIIRNIETLSKKKLRFIAIHLNEKQWTLFSGARAILTTAAVFLIVFLIFQQVQINRKLESLESNIVTSKQIIDAGITREERIQKIFNEQIISNASLKEDLKKPDFIYMNQKSLNYLLETIRQLEKENNSYRELFDKYTKDSTRKHK
jgi:precorrin isomerase